MGFLGFGGYTKPGKGVKKEEQEKKRFFAFFDIFFRKFGKLIQLNLLYVLFCIPIITIGPATVAMMKIVRYYNEGKPVFLMSDFWDAFKSNFFQGLIMGIITAVTAVLSVTALTFYYAKIPSNWLYWIPMAFISMMSLVALFASFYTFLLISTVNLKMFFILKDAIMLAFLGMKTNFITLFFTGIILAISWLFVPLTIPVLLIITFSLTAMIMCYNSFQHVYRFVIRPYYVTNNLPDPYDGDSDTVEPIFEDAT